MGGVWRQEGVRRGRCGDGCPPPHWDVSGRVLCLLPKKSILHLIQARRILVQSECFLYSSSKSFKAGLNAVNAGLNVSNLYARE